MNVVVGRVGRPHGLRGEVVVEVRTDDPDDRLAPGTTVGAEPAAAGPLTIVSGRAHGGRLVLKFRGHDDRAAAERLRGTLLVVDVDPRRRPDDPEEFYDHQLVGLGVRTVDDTPVGAVTEVLHLPGQDVLAVRTRSGTEVLVPFVAALVPTVDLEAGHLVIDPPPGLLDRSGSADPSGPGG